MPVGETRAIPSHKRDQALSDARTSVSSVRSSQTQAPQVTSHGAAEACKVPEMHASPQDIGRIDQEQFIVLEQQIRGFVIVIYLPNSHCHSGERFKRRLESFLFVKGKAPWCGGQITLDHLDASGRCSPSAPAGFGRGFSRQARRLEPHFRSAKREPRCS